jgi:CspA family cold shock protein
MAERTVKWFTAATGYRFIAPDHGTSDVFAHFSSVECSTYRELTEGQKVTLQSEQGGPQAKSGRAV